MKRELVVTGAMRSSNRFTVAKAYIRDWNKGVIIVHGIDQHDRCTCGRGDCSSPGKHPIAKYFPNGVLSATKNLNKVRAALDEHPMANVAIALKELTVVDVDGPRGKETVSRAQLQATVKSLSGRGYRLHYSGELPGGTLKGEQFDLLTGPTRYLVMPPSRHANGKVYRWSKFSKTEMAKLPSAVEKLAESLQQKPVPAKATSSRNQHLIIAEGGRNSYLTRFAGILRYAGLPQEHLFDQLASINDAVCDPPLDDDEVDTIAQSVGRYDSTFEKAFVTLSEVEEEEIEWLIEPHLIRGSLNSIDGDPGQGKSLFGAALIAAVSSGKKLPWAKHAVQGPVVILAAEDPNATVQVPRIAVNGGDLSKVHAQDIPFTLDERGLILLRSALEKHRPVLVVIDPITAYMGSGVDMHRANETTEFLAAVEALAREFNCAILIVRHLNKSPGNLAIYRGIGSIAVTARVRSGMVLGRHPEDPEIRCVAHSKSNYAKAGPTILFSLKAKPGRQPKVIWEGTTDELDAEALLARPPADRGRPNEEREAAKKFLERALDEGGVEKERIDRMAEARSISSMTLRRAADELGIIKEKVDGRSVWSLPQSTNQREGEDG